MHYSEDKILPFYATVFLTFPNKRVECAVYLSYPNTHISFMLFSVSQGKYFIITVVFIIFFFFCLHQACYRLSEGIKYVEIENYLGELLLLELEKQRKTWAIQSSCRGTQERRDVYSKGMLHLWLRDVPVPTIPAGSCLSERLFEWWW